MYILDTSFYLEVRTCSSTSNACVLWLAPPHPPKQQLTVNWDRYAEVFKNIDTQVSNCVVVERFPMSFVLFLSEIANAHNLLPSIWQTHQ